MEYKESLNFKITYWFIKAAIKLGIYKLDYYAEAVDVGSEEGLMVSLVCEPRWIWQKRHPKT